MKASAWHCTSKYFTENHFKEPPDAAILNKTHFKLPVIYYALSIHNVPEMLNASFNFFNWVQLEFVAPQSVNDSAREHGTHASMSVGDLVEIDGTFYACRPSGWEKLSEGGLHNDKRTFVRSEEMAGKPWPENVL